MCPIALAASPKLYRPAQQREGISMQGYAVAQPELRLERDGDIAFIVAEQPGPHERVHRRHVEGGARGSSASRGRSGDPRHRAARRRRRAPSRPAPTSRSSRAPAPATAAAAYDALNDAAFQALSGCAKPTIAMIHGYCLGGGLGHRAVHRHPHRRRGGRVRHPRRQAGARLQRALGAAPARRRPAGAGQGDAVHRLALQCCRGAAMGLVNTVVTAERSERRRGRLPATSPPTRRSPCVPPSAPSTS